MLNPQTAKERLREFSKKDSESRRQGRIGGLGVASSPIAWALLDRGAAGQKIAGLQKTEAIKGAQALLEKLPESARKTLFSVFFPQMGEAVEAAWQLQKGLPYQTSWQRKSFRAPNTPITTLPKRWQWLQALIHITAPYEQDAAWFAAWSPYLGYNAPDTLGYLFAGAIEAGGPKGEEVFNVLVQSARGEHEIGGMGRHVTRALLDSSRPEGWEFMEKMLLAAQAQEGLRQTILESVDEAHPTAYRRMLRLIVEHDLIRFSATLRAVDVWFGFQWDTLTAKIAAETVQQVLALLEDRQAREAKLVDGAAADQYMALWTMAFEDAVATVPQAQRLLADQNPERRFVTVHLLSQLGLVKATEAVIPSLFDPDLRVAARALDTVRNGNAKDKDVFERLEVVIPRFPLKKTELDPIVWPWMKQSAHREDIADCLVANLGSRSPRRLIPHVEAMSANGRHTMASLLAKALKEPAPAEVVKDAVKTTATGIAAVWNKIASFGKSKAKPEAAQAPAPAPATDNDIRDALFALVGDPSTWVRRSVLEALKSCKLSESEAERMEGLLTRKANDLRRGVIGLLLSQKDPSALASARRLSESKNSEQRAAGLEILRQMIKDNRSAANARALLGEEGARSRSAGEEKLVEALLDTSRKEATLDDSLGLMNPADRTKPIAPVARNRFPLKSTAAKECIVLLEGLVNEHRQEPITVENYGGQAEEVLLGSVGWQFPKPKAGQALEQGFASVPLCELWQIWYANRPANAKDPDGFELWRAIAAIIGQTRWWGQKDEDWRKKAQDTLFTHINLEDIKHQPVVSSVLRWLAALHSTPDTPDFLIDAIETTFAQFPNFSAWRDNRQVIAWLEVAREHRSLCPDLWTAEHNRRLWPLLRWMDEPMAKAPRQRPNLSEVVGAFEAGAATEADLLDQLMGPAGAEKPKTGGYYYVPRGGHFPDLQKLSGRKGTPELTRCPALAQAVEKCRARIVEVEAERGDLPTAASRPALALRWSGGLHTLVRFLAAFGKDTFERGYGGSESRSAVFSHLVRATFPGPEYTPERFAERLTEAKIKEKRLIENAVYAPQWAGHFEKMLGWKGLAEGVWWLHAHTKDTQWTVDQEIRETWAAEVSERTPLTGQNLMSGAVDVAWFKRVYGQLGADRWLALDDAAKYASGGGGHKRAQMFADAMLGRMKKEELAARIKEKRNQDAVRALGLVPLDEGADREADLLARYLAIQEFLRESRKFGSQRQASEKQAALIGMENLARTAGYPDPSRLMWAMEAREVADLAEGPVKASAGDVEVKLKINEWGEPEVSATKAGKLLKAIPPVAKKDAGIARLVERRREIERQAQRMRRSLEEAMCRGDEFTGNELGKLLAHPVLAPMIRSLVFIGPEFLGYPVEAGSALEAHDGVRHTLRAEELVRIAHPHDMLVTKDWAEWQRECFLHERIQPFKQVFRELYILTKTETDDGNLSRRYAGHQVGRMRAQALLGKCGWVANFEEGDVRRTFHAEGIIAALGIDYGFTTPAEVEGMTIDRVQFARRGEWAAMPLADVPPRVFSEAMRDLDLVVSVAHQGGVDPEASASTVEMRGALIREACRLLKLGNVEMKGAHALIEGHLGSYSVHLGSAVVHRQPGGHLCIVPVHSQHRGRVFLPFVDDDPRTAEVLSKVVLLAKDKEIKDPILLEQIMAKG